MPVVRGGRIVADDPWVSVADDAPLPDGRPAVVSLARWRNERETLARREAPLGLRLGSSDPVTEIVADVAHFQLIVLEFPKLNDGRGFSAARLLRERYRFAGEIRAVGHIIPDQLQFLARCGVDSLEAADDSWGERWRIAQEEISVVYQPAADARRPAFRLRHQPRAAE